MACTMEMLERRASLSDSAVRYVWKNRGEEDGVVLREGRESVCGAGVGCMRM
jgi:hypothetical protein